ncbi:16006_t:CDS:1, partial [Gigaspora margarita]
LLKIHEKTMFKMRTTYNPKISSIPYRLSRIFSITTPMRLSLARKKRIEESWTANNNKRLCQVLPKYKYEQ